MTGGGGHQRVLRGFVRGVQGFVGGVLVPQEGGSR